MAADKDDDDASIETAKLGKSAEKKKKKRREKQVKFAAALVMMQASTGFMPGMRYP